jgi:glycosyltransferase involved in cell wall biosynthesis
MVFAEALSAGLPIVGYRAGAVPDVVPAGAGFLVEPGDIDALAGSIGKVLADPSEADAMAAQALEAAKDLPGWDMTAGFIHRVLAEKTRQ